MLTPSAAKHGGSLAGKDSKSAVSITSSRTAAMVTLFGQVRWEGPAEAQQDDRKVSFVSDGPAKKHGFGIAVFARCRQDLK